MRSQHPLGPAAAWLRMGTRSGAGSKRWAQLVQAPRDGSTGSGWREAGAPQLATAVDASGAYIWYPPCRWMTFTPSMATS